MTAEIPSRGEEPIIKSTSCINKDLEAVEQIIKQMKQEVATSTETSENLQISDADQAKIRIQSHPGEQPRRSWRGLKFPGLRVSPQPEHEEPKASDS